MEFKYDAYCGLYCGACGVLIANERDKLEQLAKAWKVEPEKLECHGCKSETSSSFCVSCNIRSCAESKDKETAQSWQPTVWIYFENTASKQR